jgi:hypothetical protein
MTPSRGLASTWDSGDRIEIGVLLAVIVLMHLAGFATLVLMIAPRHYQTGTGVFSIGLASPPIFSACGTPSTPITSPPSTTPPAS